MSTNKGKYDSSEIDSNIMKKFLEDKNIVVASICETLNDNKYKTELCKNFVEFNNCTYGPACRYAHGVEEKVEKQVKNYKQKPCKSFKETGYCRYGIRCNFKHDERILKKNSIFKTKLKFLESFGSFFVEKFIDQEKTCNIKSGKKLNFFEKLRSEFNKIESTTSANSCNSSVLDDIKPGNDYSIDDNCMDTVICRKNMLYM